MREAMTANDNGSGTVPSVDSGNELAGIIDQGSAELMRLAWENETHQEVTSQLSAGTDKLLRRLAELKGENLALRAVNKEITADLATTVRTLQETQAQLTAAIGSVAVHETMKGVSGRLGDFGRRLGQRLHRIEAK